MATSRTVIAKQILSIVFGAAAQVLVGIAFLVATIYQTWYWGIHTKATVDALFYVSMEALAFASYAIIATGLGYRATERVEKVVVENIENVDIEGSETP
jgi:membrane protein implicated in regulation of membrane protease activity